MNPLTRNLLVLDIETVSVHGDYTGLNDDMRKHWDHKSSFFRNDDAKGPDELYADKAAIYAEFGKVITIAMGYFADADGQLTLRMKTLAHDDEKTLLQQFVAVLEKFDQDNLRLCAHNGKEFDFPYLCRRLVVNGIDIPWALDMSGKKPWEVNHVDTMDMWKFGDRKNFTSLSLLTDLLGIPSSKDGMDGSKVHHTYYHEKDGLQKVAHYCQGDVIATAQLYLRLHNLPLLEPAQIIQSNG
jgi:uncharacterized protein YprB with RNaseH-like and TPR domain